MASALSPRQPVHTVYGGAQLFSAETAPKLARLARQALERMAPDANTFGAAFGMGGEAAAVYELVRAKLAADPVEDYRIDFEDGYGYRSGEEEDAHARSVASALAASRDAGTLPPSIGIRVKSWRPEIRPRSQRTLEIVLRGIEGPLPQGFLVTLPKVETPAQVASLAGTLARLERECGFRPDSLGIEIMVETPLLLGHLREAVQAAEGRCVAVHFGAYDYTSSCGITARHQDIAHPACDFARFQMQAELACTGVRLADSVTTVLPILAEGWESVAQAWRLHYSNIRRSMAHGFYQSWDLHPAQLVARYAAVYSFYLEAIPAASERLKELIRQAAQATRVRETFDDLASGEGLMLFFRRALECGAVAESALPSITGLSAAEIRAGSLAQLLSGAR